MPARPFVLVGQQYLADPTRSAGDIHPLWTYAHVPNGFSGDATEAIIAQIERFAPGFRDRVVGMSVRSTTEIAVYNPNYVGGDILTGSKDPRQLVFGPRTTLAPYSVGHPRQLHLFRRHPTWARRPRDVRDERRRDGATRVGEAEVANRRHPVQPSISTY